MLLCIEAQAMEFLGSWFNASVASSSVSSNLRGTDALPSESTVVGNGNRLTSLENQFRLPVEWVNMFWNMDPARSSFSPKLAAIVTGRPTMGQE